LEIKIWQARGEDKKNYKKTIQDLFKSEVGLLVDEVKPDGSGRPNDGNTGR
jgi:hypothetical protein